MFKLSQLLTLLDREGVDLVILQEGSVPHVRDRGSVRPVSRQSTDRAAIEAVMKTAHIEQALHSVNAGAVDSIPFDAGGQHYEAELLLRKGRLQLRLSVGEPQDVIQLSEEDALETPPAVPPVPEPKRAAVSLESILNECRRIGATDLHISAGYAPKVRLMEKLKDRGAPLSSKEVEKMLMSALNEAQKTALADVGYADLAMDFQKAGRMRVNISRQRGGLKGCFRLIAMAPLPLERLGLPSELAKITLHNQGLVVISGPNGSGKTTTMASLVDLFNAEKPIHIITVEDPVEIVHPPKMAVVSQRQVGAHTKSFQSALKGGLREDPDVIAIGELRDQETVEMALSAAETGHLVIATMSTPSGAETIDRLIDIFPQGVQSQVRNTLAGTIKMVISQRLVPGADGKSRHVAAELITGNIPLYAMIRDNKLFQLPSLLQQGKAYGMIRIEDSLNALVEKELVTAETAKLYANDPNAIGRRAAPEASQPTSPLTEKTGRFGMMANKLRGK